jgi:anaerobic C4-dicarboxylate transporter
MGVGLGDGLGPGVGVRVGDRVGPGVGVGVGNGGGIGFSIGARRAMSDGGNERVRVIEYVSAVVSAERRCHGSSLLGKQVDR